MSLLFWLIFSILGVQLFSGKFQACVDHDGERVPASVVPNKTECLRFPEKYVWKNSEANFDNVLNGFLVLFLVVCMLQFIPRTVIYRSRRIRLTCAPNRSVECGLALSILLSITSTRHHSGQNAVDSRGAANI